MGCSIFRFMGSHNLREWTRIGAMNPFLQRKPKRQRTGAVQDLAESRKHVALACVLECGSPLPLSDERFMESFNLQDWTRIGAMNRLDEVGRVTPCAPSFALWTSVVAAAGAQRTARPTFRFMEASFSF